MSVLSAPRLPVSRTWGGWRSRLLDRLLRRTPEVSPLSQTIDLDDARISAHPFPAYEQLRREECVVYLARHRFWLVLGYEAAREALASPERFSSSPNAFVDQAMLSLDPPRHSAVRRVVSRAFGGEALGRAERLATATAEGLIRPRLEVAREFARPVSRAVAADLIGFDAEALEQIAKAEDEEKPSGATGAFVRICAVLDRLAAKAGMFARLSEDGADLLGSEEVRSLVRLLWLASTATTERAIAVAILRLVQDPALHCRLRAEPGLVPSFVEEVIRLHPPENLVLRRVVADTRLAGVPIPAGAELNICLPAANRDPLIFEAPAELRLGRDGEGALSFGYGIHHCVGAPMTRRVVTAVVRVFVAAVKEPNLDAEVQWVHAMRVLTPRELRIRT